jgi:patatin-like phospholipase/acyl hydrolase
MILTLYSGGVRSIVELQVLKAIKKVLGPKLPLQLFFDLIIGSGSVIPARHFPTASVLTFTELVA